MSDWWWIALLLYLPGIVHELAIVAYMRGTHDLDAEIPDDLPYTAGDWLEREIDRLGLHGRVRTIVSEKSKRNAFHPQRSVIQLKVDTHFKRDAVHWATAAHELGHAQLWTHRPRLAGWLHRAELACYLLGITGIAIAIGNVLFALPGATALALRLLVVAAILQLSRLGTEAHASILGMRSLRASPVLGRHHLKASRSALVLAWDTYFARTAARTLLLTQWHLVERLSTVPRVPPLATLTPFGLAVAIALTAVLVTIAIVQLLAIANPELGVIAQLFSIVRTAAVAGFIYLTWNYRADHVWAYLVMAAFAQAIGVVSLVLALPFIIVDAIVLRPIVKRATAIDGVHQSPQLERDRRSGRRLIEQGDRDVFELTSHSLVQRLWSLVELSFVPLVFAYWIL